MDEDESRREGMLDLIDEEQKRGAKGSRRYNILSKPKQTYRGVYCILSK